MTSWIEGSTQMRSVLGKDNISQGTCQRMAGMFCYPALLKCPLQPPQPTHDPGITHQPSEHPSAQLLQPPPIPLLPWAFLCTHSQPSTSCSASQARPDSHAPHCPWVPRHLWGQQD